MSQNICRDYELAEIFRKLRTEKPTVYYTKYNSGHTHKWDKEEGYYEIRQSSFGPIMLWQYLYNEFECVHRIEMKIKNTEEHCVGNDDPIAGSDNVWYYNVNDFLVNYANILPSHRSNKGVARLWNTYLSKDKEEYKECQRRIKEINAKDILSDEDIESILSDPVFDFARYATRIVHPWSDWDFQREPGMIPDLSLAVPLVVGAAMKIAPMVQYVLMNTHQM